jgi:hypothetical protein
VLLNNIFMKALISGVLGLILVTPFIASACIGLVDNTREEYDMMGYGGNTFCFFGTAIHLLLIVIGVLTTVWLWKQINKK